MKALNNQQTRELEQWAVDEGIPYITLMEHAGTAVAEYISSHYNIREKRTVILCGKGNNGGDGFVVARRLDAAGGEVIIALVDGLPKTDIAKETLSRIRQTNVQAFSIADDQELIFELIRTADVLVDCIYGIGFKGTPDARMTEVLETANLSGADKIAVDIPSGIECDTGTVDTVCFQADVTITFTTMKTAHLLSPAKEYCGEIVVADVGIPHNLVAQQEADIEVAEEWQIESMFKPRKQNTNKGDYGHMLCICGSEGMAGAAIMCGKAALRSGTGLVHMVVPKEIYPIVAGQLTEPIYTVLYRERMLQQLDEAMEKATACVIGCGMGTSETAKLILTYVLKHFKHPIVLDADALNIVSEDIELLQNTTVPLILTPHPGEMARLLKITTKEVQRNRLQISREFAKKHGITLVLKGSGTVVAAHYGKISMNPTGNAGMAKGGSGDVLAGMIGGILAQGEAPFEAARTAVYLHGMAGDKCADKLSQISMLPTDMIEELPRLFLKFEK